MTDDRHGILLNDLAFARPGDKGNDVDVTVFARSAAAYDHLVVVLTADLVKSHFGELVQGDVVRFEVPNVWALKFLLCEALAGGGPRSLRADNLGKALGGAILRLRVPVPSDRVGQSIFGLDVHPPPDPYKGADWLIP